MIDASTRRRLLAVVFGPLYYVLVVQLFANIADAPAGCVAAIVAAAAGVEIAVLVALAKRLVMRKRSGTRFGLGTMLLVTTGLAIYFAAFGVVARSIPDSTGPLPMHIKLMLGCFGVIFVFISTMALASFADAVVYFARLLHHGRSKR